MGENILTVINLKIYRELKQIAELENNEDKAKVIADIIETVIEGLNREEYFTVLEHLYDRYFADKFGGDEILY